MTPVHRLKKRIPGTVLAGLLAAAWPALPMPGPALGEEPSLPAARVEKARKMITLSGYTRSRTRMTVASEVPGKVLRVNYDVGQTVGRRPFIEIDPTFIDFQIQQVDASLKKLDIARSRAASRVSYLEKEYQRIARLRQSDVASVSRYDAATEELTQARLELQSTDIEMGSLEIQLRELREKRGRHRIFAPEGWVLVEKAVEAGEIITPGRPLGQAADFNQLVVPLYVSADELSAFDRGAPMTITLEGRPVQAAINWINPEFDEGTRKLAVELIIADFQGDRRGGLLAELTLEIDADGLMVPKAAVTDRFDNPRVTLMADGRNVPIVILGEQGSHVLIAGHQGLAPGTALRVAPPQP